MSTPPLTYVPATWYSATATCHTPTCPNLDRVMDVPLLYSNGGDPVVVCGLCSKRAEILTATLLDPQPEES